MCVCVCVTYTCPPILSQLQPCRRAEAANLLLNFLTTVLTVSRRAGPGIFMSAYKKHTFSKYSD